ncbi:hypothetical protein SKAU_G00307580 [Synaphobranchus kaupii]|uniref:Uncharacterized protein n=1 Tax=Synaphobranchus kaupii TaxID=118154 RepID=A0A9Q1EQW8_SYNKA|nr:hypothetical protein SKAU_G00307580 [Synaphobranchus kaupii]
MEVGLAVIGVTGVAVLLAKTWNHQATERRDSETILKLQQELNDCKESARIHYEELKVWININDAHTCGVGILICMELLLVLYTYNYLNIKISYIEKESSDQRLEEAAQTAQEDRDSESLRYCSIVQALEEEMAALTDMCKSKDRRLFAMAEESDRREGELIAMYERCGRKEKHLVAAADQLEDSERKLAAMTELCQSNEDQLQNMEEMEEMYETTMRQLIIGNQEELAAMASRLAVSKNKLEDMTQLCQSKDEQLQEMAKVNKATLDNLEDERRFGQQSFENLETVTQLLSDKEKELEEDMEETEETYETMEIMTQIMNSNKEELAAMASRLEVSKNKLAAMTELCQSNEDQVQDMEETEEMYETMEIMTQIMNSNKEELAAMALRLEVSEKKLEDAAVLRGTLETVLQQKIKREESQQLPMERVEQEFERRMSESQRTLEEERAEAASLRKKLADVVCELAGLQKPPSPTPTPGCSNVQETLPVEDENATKALDRDGHGKEIQEAQKQADPEEQMLAQQLSGGRKRKKKTRWVKVEFENYRPNHWFTEDQVINRQGQSSQTQMSSDQHGRGSDARRAGAGAEGLGRRDQGAAGHQRSREIEWAEYNPYRTVKGPSNL